ncbi:hypothetical protein CXK94_12870 [Stutzerimonas stutzeri]|uniref:DUF2726 domain-containing protein n=1 Tax=Stutzerimonas stutzeri TaxID=316 RepID=A0A2N8T3Y4_STUST|nr:DUF2726 domain-containing protein [Stutzerimonas stutzeri]MCQ4323838.1 DUF2726 domain-containing protein [Stutzerimonas stutzeri]PNG09415.1 hypothetical protein CXK94_12870 [Stutzerimonas stutzeri]
MSWLALTLVAFVCFVLVFFIKNRQLNHPALQFPYRLKEPLFAPAERELLATLQRSAGDDYLILAKVGVADVVEVTALARRAYWYRATNRIAAQRFDFLLCRKRDLAAVCALKLDEPQAADDFLDQLCRTVDLPLIRLSPEAAGSFREVREALDRAMLH